MKYQTTNMLLLVTFSMMLFTLSKARIKMCLNRDIPGLDIGRILVNRTLYAYHATGLMDCLRYCKRHMACMSVNFDITSSLCDINLDSTGQFELDLNYVYWEAEPIAPSLLGGCSEHQCLQNERCEERADGTGYSCIAVRCIGTNIPLVPNVQESSFAKKEFWAFNETVAYPCKEGFRPSTNVLCQENGRWTDFICLTFQSCKDIQRCGVYVAGEYWLEVYPGQPKLKVFCKLGPTSAGHYITLLDLNKSETSSDIRVSNQSCAYSTQTEPYSDTAMGVTHFQKIFLYRPGDYLLGTRGNFNNSTGTKQGFGYAGDCCSTGDSCDSRGSFVVNLIGTGFRVKDSVTWKATGTMGKIDFVNRSGDGRIVAGRCGGFCGGCVTKTKLYVESDPSHVYPSNVVATTPSCPSLLK